MQEGRNSSALTMALRPSCTKPLILRYHCRVFSSWIETIRDMPSKQESGQSWALPILIIKPSYMCQILMNASIII